MYILDLTRGGSLFIMSLNADHDQVSSDRRESHSKISDRIKFYDLCLVFEKIKNSVASEKHFVFDKFLKRWNDLAIIVGQDNSYEFSTADSFYEPLRLFIPSRDTRSFRIKEVCLMFFPLQ